MARAKGSDGFLELMDTVAALEKSTAEQARRFVLLDTRMGLVEDNMQLLAEGMQRLIVRVHELRSSVTDLKSGAEETNSLVRRMSQLLVATQGENNTRFSSLDDRVTRLERKTG